MLLCRVRVGAAERQAVGRQKDDVMRTRKVSLLVSLALVSFLLVDRIVLYLWATQVIQLYRGMQSAVQREEHRPPETRFGYVSVGLEPLLVMPKDERWPIRYLSIHTDRILAKPNGIVVDAAGGVHLRFLPPLAAWTTWLIPRTDPGHHADPVGADSRLHYQYRIDIEPTPSDSATVTLRRGPHHFSDPLKSHELHPLILP